MFHFSAIISALRNCDTSWGPSLSTQPADPENGSSNPRSRSAVIAALTGGEERDRRVRAARELYDRAYSRAAYEAKMRRLLEVLR